MQPLRRAQRRSVPVLLVLIIVGMVATLVRLTSASGTPNQTPMLAAATATATATAPPQSPIPSVLTGTVQPGPSATVVFGTPPPNLGGSVRNSINTPSPAGTPLPCEGDYVRNRLPVTPVPIPALAVGQPNARIFVATPAPASAQPVLYGPFRLVPSGYTQPLHVQALHCPPPTQTVPFSTTQDASVVKRSSLFKQPASLPPGYRLTHMSGGGPGNAEQNVDLYYEGPQNPIEVTISRVDVTPVDYDMPPVDGSYPFVVEQTQVAGFPAIIGHQAFRLDDDVHVEFVQDGVLFALTGRAHTLADVPTVVQQLTQMANSLR